MNVHGVELRDFKKEPLQVLSFGGGVQSFAMLLLIKEGLLPKPDIIIHSDTGSEMPHTEKIIQISESIAIEINVPFLIVKSHRGTLHDDYISNGSVPVVGFRSCTLNFKVYPQRRAIREIVGNSRGSLLAECWLGITTDESHRMMEGEFEWIGNKFPLLDIGYSRKMCVDLNNKYNYEVKKSGCFCCPYSGKKNFIRLFQEHPDLFEICIKMEKSYQEKYGNDKGLVPTIENIKHLKINSLMSFGAEILTENESSCDTGGCFL